MNGEHRILIVEDDEVIRESLREYLEDHGFEAEGAVHGLDALSKLDGLRPLPCLIVLDLMMPVMDGIAFREEQLRHPELRAIPVLVISAHKDVRQSAEELHASGHLAKPLQLSEFLAEVKRHC